MNLTSKLGVKPWLSSFCLHAPDGYQRILPGVDCVDAENLPEQVDWLQAFYIRSDQLGKEIDYLKARLKTNGQLWLSWPKKSSGVDSDLSDSVVRSIGLKAGLVDVKIVAIDETWSALKFVYRLKDR